MATATITKIQKRIKMIYEQHVRFNKYTITASEVYARMDGRWGNIGSLELKIGDTFEEIKQMLQEL